MCVPLAAIFLASYNRNTHTSIHTLNTNYRKMNPWSIVKACHKDFRTIVTTGYRM